jgi:hypothetical protein
MASFPTLRPDRGSADAERRALRSFGRLAVLLAGLAALLAYAFPAVSELATLRGAKALVPTPAFLTLHVRGPAAGTGAAA